MPSSPPPDGNRSSSLLPPALRWAGPLLACGYGLGGRLHRAFTKPLRAPLPTICIGNITVGGTGKTPAAKYFARGLAQRGHKPAVLMRGYKGQASDEGVEVQHALADLKIPVLIGADRLASAQRAKEQGHDCVLLDDGFQHWKLARDLDIVLVDATDPFGGGHLAPWGKLRESPAALARAGVVIVTRSDMVTAEELARVQKEVTQLAPAAIAARAVHRPARLRTLDGSQEFPLEKLRNMSLIVLCGIGNPHGFCGTLMGLGADILKLVSRPDHDMLLDETVYDLIADFPGTPIIVTEKDAAKLAPLFDEPKLWVLEVAFTVVDSDGAVWAKIENALSPAATG